ncbi:hypothetical protein SAMN06298216_1369 [Spirosomataceae bacterium TFI 002]|nr:hypothetical protein SAMN06298216_1369 [Spirosomataceae bacterium TFI 002]
MKITACINLLVLSLLSLFASGQTSPDKINFVRQGVKRMIFDSDQSIPLAKLDPSKVVGFSAMYPTEHYMDQKSEVEIRDKMLVISSQSKTQTSIWFGGFNPVATYTIELKEISGKGYLGFEFSDAEKKDQFFIKIAYDGNTLNDVELVVSRDSKNIVAQSIAVNKEEGRELKGRIILQMLGSGLTLFHQKENLPEVIAKSDFNKFIDLRAKQYLNTFQSRLFAEIEKGSVQIESVDMILSTGMGQADIRAITYENGEPMLDKGRLWYTMSIRGRALPHHIQGVFSMNPSVFDVKLEGVILFDRNDGLLRNEVASHIFYDRKDEVWRGITTGFSAYAFPEKEKKQLLAIESKSDPRFGFSIMKAEPFGMVGDIEDPHLLYDSAAKKWRMLTCENVNGYKAIVLESDFWNKEFHKIAGPVAYNSTGTSIQKIGDKLFCFSGSADRKILIYTYPDLKDAGSLKMDLPPWDNTSGTRVWPNIVQLPEGYPFKYVALMMDRFNYPTLKGPNWTYGALYLYHGAD